MASCNPNQRVRNVLYCPFIFCKILDILIKLIIIMKCTLCNLHCSIWIMKFAFWNLILWNCIDQIVLFIVSIPFICICSRYMVQLFYVVLSSFEWFCVVLSGFGCFQWFWVLWGGFATESHEDQVRQVHTLLNPYRKLPTKACPDPLKNCQIHWNP